MLRYLQIPVDLIFFTIIIHMVGGVVGPLFVLYFLYIFASLAILPQAGTYFVAAFASLCYGGLAFYEANYQPPIGNPIGVPVGTPMSMSTSHYFGYFLAVSTTLFITAYIARRFSRLLAEDERTIRQQLGEINTLYSFTRQISASASVDEIVNTLAVTAREMEGAQACAFLLFDENGQGRFAALTLSAESKVLSAESSSSVSTQHSALSTQHFSIDHPLIKPLLSRDEGIFAPNVDAVPHLAQLGPALLRAKTRSLYAVPMTTEGKLAGFLVLSFDRPYTMPQGNWSLLYSMTQQAALAIERRRLFADAQRAAREMASLYYIGLACTSSLRIDEALRLIYEQVGPAVRPDTFYIALYDEELNELRFEIFIEGGEALPPFRSRLENLGISGWVVRNRKPVFIRHWDAEIDQLPFESNVVGAPTQSAIAVPLVAKNKTVGVMSVQAVQPDAFDQSHLRLLTAIASQAALALENAQLHTQVNEQAQRDPLTGVYHHGTLIDKLHSSVRRGLQERKTLALIMLDIDNFKRYNDTYGHMVGDDVLRSTVAAIQGHLKSTDVVGRWGGEEFGIVLQDVNRSQAYSIAERIRRTVAANVMKDTRNRSIPSPTVSQGIALFPEDAAHVEELIDRADSALFRAKDRGRNQIVDWTEMDVREAEVEPMELEAVHG